MGIFDKFKIYKTRNEIKDTDEIVDSVFVSSAVGETVIDERTGTKYVIGQNGKVKKDNIVIDIDDNIEHTEKKVSEKVDITKAEVEVKLDNKIKEANKKIEETKLTALSSIDKVKETVYSDLAVKEKMLLDNITNINASMEKAKIEYSQMMQKAMNDFENEMAANMTIANQSVTSVKKESYSNMYKYMKEAKDTMDEYLRVINNKISSTDVALRELLTQTEKDVKSYSDAVTSTKEALLRELIANEIVRVNKGMDDLDKKHIHLNDVMYGDMGKMSEDVQGMMLDYKKELIDNIDSEVTDITNLVKVVENSFNNDIGKLKSDFAVSKEEFTGFIDKQNSAIYEKIDSLKLTLSNKILDVDDKHDTIADTFKKMMESMAIDIKNLMGDMSDKVNDNLEGLDDQVKDSVKVLYSYVDTEVAKVKDTLTEKIDTLSSRVENYKSEFESTMVEMSASIAYNKTEMENYTNSVRNSIMKVMEEYNDSLKIQLSDINKDIIKRDKTAVADSKKYTDANVTKLETTILNLRDEANKAIEANKKDIDSKYRAIDGTMKSLKTKVESNMGVMKKAVDDNISSLVNKFNTYIKNINNDISSNSKKIDTHTTEISNIKSILNTMTGIDTFYTKMDEASKSISDAYNKAKKYTDDKLKGYLKVTGGVLSGPLEIKSSNARVILNSTTDKNADVSIGAEGEDFVIREPEDNDKEWLRIKDDKYMTVFGIRMLSETYAKLRTVLTLKAGDDGGLTFPSNPFGGGGDKAWLKLRRKSGEDMSLEIGIANDGNDTIDFKTPASSGLRHNGNEIAVKKDVLAKSQMYKNRTGRYGKGWYVIGAANDGRTYGKFTITIAHSGRHDRIEFEAYIRYRQSPRINILSTSNYATNVITSLRIDGNGTYDGGMLMMYVNESNITMAISYKINLESYENDWIINSVRSYSDRRNYWNSDFWRSKYGRYKELYRISNLDQIVRYNSDFREYRVSKNIVGTNIDDGHPGVSFFTHGKTRRKLRMHTEDRTPRIADTFSSNTDKAYIFFDEFTNSNDPGYIMHETRHEGETNEGVLHLCPSDDNAYGDYVSIHGTDDPDSLKFHTDGTIEGVNSIKLKGNKSSNIKNVNSIHFNNGAGDNVSVGIDGEDFVIREPEDKDKEWLRIKDDKYMTVFGKRVGYHEYSSMVVRRYFKHTVKRKTSGSQPIEVFYAAMMSEDYFQKLKNEYKYWASYYIPRYVTIPFNGDVDHNDKLAIGGWTKDDGKCGNKHCVEITIKTGNTEMRSDIVVYFFIDYVFNNQTFEMRTY